MTNMKHLGSIVTLRDFKTYLLSEGVRSLTDIQVLYEHFEIILKTYRRTVKKKKEAGSGIEKETIARKVYQNIKRLIGQGQTSSTNTEMSSSYAIETAYHL